MTLEVEFFTEDAALWHVRYCLKTFPSDDIPFAFAPVGTACILCLSAALESIVNNLLDSNSTFKNWDELKLRSKIETLFEIKNEVINWSGGDPQKIIQLIKVRNWLAHNKQTYLGLVGGENHDTWIKDEINKSPKIDIISELSKQSIESYYRAILGLITDLCKIYDLEWELEKFANEDYWPIIS